MSRPSAFAAIVLLIAALVCQHSVAQPAQPPQGFLAVHNLSGQTVTVFIRAQGTENKDKNWQKPIKVEEGKTEDLPLVGVEPFDISIRQEDGTAVVVSREALISLMKQAPAQGGHDVMLVSQVWRHEKDENGNPVDKMDVGPGFRLDAHVDKAKVTIRFYDPPRGPKPRPK